MDQKEILRKCDHTNLSPTATWEDIRMTLTDAMTFGTATACIPPAYIRQARAYVGDRLPLCTVIGFPNGYATTAVKVAETMDALESGADEIDMVIPLGAVKEGDDRRVEREIRAVRTACGDHILKVIIETCFLTDEEKIRMCDIVTSAGADYIKTSTGFGTAGATFDDIKLFSEHIGEGVKMKAAGGISSLDDAERFLELGADRLGTSRVVKLIKAMD